MTVVSAVLRAVTLIAVVVVFAACSGGGAAASVSPPPDADVSIDAKDHKFSPTDLSIPAGEPFQLFFRNLDGARHNVAIYPADSASQSIFVGETVTDAAVTYEVPAIEAGAYFFRCDVHPEMVGTIRAGG